MQENIDLLSGEAIGKPKKPSRLKLLAIRTLRNTPPCCIYLFTILCIFFIFYIFWPSDRPHISEETHSEFVSNFERGRYEYLTFITHEDQFAAVAWICHMNTIDPFVVTKTRFVMFGDFGLPLENTQVTKLSLVHSRSDLPRLKSNILDSLLLHSIHFTLFDVWTFWKTSTVLDIKEKYGKLLSEKQIFGFPDDVWRLTIFHPNFPTTLTTLTATGYPSLEEDATVETYSNLQDLKASDNYFVNHEGQCQKPASGAVVKPPSDEISIDESVKMDSKPAMTICLLTMDRLRALKRLCEAIKVAEYDNQRVDVIFSVDVRNHDPPHQGVKEFIEGYQWPHGEKKINIHTKNQGLFWQWINTCDAVKSEEDYVIVLEDDMDVVPGYFKYIMKIKDTYFKKCDKIAGVSLQRLTWRPSKHDQAFVCENGHNPFASLLVGTWGHLINPVFWLDFQAWVRDKRDNEPSYYPRVPGLVMDDWYGAFISQGTQWNMWSMWHIKYCDEFKWYSIYPNLAEKRTLGTTWTEKGLHEGGGILKRNNELAKPDTEGMENFGFPLKYFDWAGNEVTGMTCKA